jgi:hypothetical protein
MVYNPNAPTSHILEFPLHVPGKCEVPPKLIDSAWSEHGADWQALADPNNPPAFQDVIAAFEPIDYKAGFQIFCEGIQVYEFLTREYVRALAEHLKRVEQALQLDRPLRVLDVGAGNGRLSSALSAELSVLGSSAQLSAVDAGAYSIKPVFPVINMDYESALAMTAPDVVLASWMPRGKDWTKTFRSYGVAQYILIGEPDNGVCGEREATWGTVLKADGTGIDRLPNPEYEKDGYVRGQLYAGNQPAKQWQLNRYDKFNVHHREYERSFRSDTVIFTKQTA